MCPYTFFLLMGLQALFYVQIVIWYSVHVFQSSARGTVKEKPGFNPSEDVAALRKAIEGLGEAPPNYLDLQLLTE